VTPGDLPPAASPDAPDAPPPAADHGLSARGWLNQNWPSLAMIALLFGMAYWQWGPEALLAGLKVALGLGFVIFIHELGHFLAAKWCDVHVVTFSIGFGPALPGCHFQRGETTYKLALLPLGGYVNMVGEGPEADEDEDYPRSFKNKPVGQRMLIISAGVIMNVLFGFLCFVIVYRYHGVDRPPAVVWQTEAGSRAWEKGVRPGWQITRIGDKQDPWFDDMRVIVALSREGREVQFEFVDRDGKKHAVPMEPFRDDNNLMPVIGVRPPDELRLLPERAKRQHSLPVSYDSATARARALNLAPRDRVVEATSPLHGDAVKPLRVDLRPLDAVRALLPRAPVGVFSAALVAAERSQQSPGFEWQELAHRMSLAGDRTMELRVLRSGAAAGAKPESVALRPGGFAFDDRIVGTTDPATPERPFNVTYLPAPPDDSEKRAAEGPFLFRRRMAALAGRPVVMRVERDGGVVEDVFVPPAYHRTLGLRMKMGEIAAVRSPAAEAFDQAKVPRVGMRISGVSVAYDGEPFRPLLDGPIDPVRLPSDLERHVNADPRRDPSKWRVQLKVRGKIHHDSNEERTLPPMAWDASFAVGEEASLARSSPMSIPQLGVAYRVESTVEAVEPGSPAERAGFKAGDQVQQMRFRDGGKTPDAEKWTKWLEMASKRGKEEPYDQWAHFFRYLQLADHPQVEMKVQREGKPWKVTRDGKETDVIAVEAARDLTWPLADRGLMLMPDHRRQQADSLVEAVAFGLDRTWGFIQQIYLNLSSLITGRISPKSLGGPIEIASQAFSFAGEDLFTFALFLGIISINLAVVNFLPIPVLDGGHMVFLLYEAIRRKPPSETVRVVATYIGLAIIGSLMIFVFYLDINRRFF
jgi:membrane-associated protease RseP (regulator of RpoE activity)